MKSKKQPTNDPGDIFRSRIPGIGIHSVAWENGRIVVPIACVEAGTSLSKSETGEWILTYHSESSSLVLLPKLVWGRQGEGIRTYLEQENGKVTDKDYWILYVAPAKSFTMGTKRRVTIPKPSLTEFVNFGKGDEIVIVKPGLSYFVITGAPDHLHEKEKAHPHPPIPAMPAQQTPDGIKKRDEKAS